LCREFFLINYSDKDGNECVEALYKATSGTAEALDLGDIMDRTRIKVEPPDHKEIICQPVVKYNYDSASGEYQGKIEVTNASAPTYSASYVKGISDGDTAERIWNRCHVLWQMNRMVNDTPSELSDLKWANGVDGQKIATWYLEQMVEWQGLHIITFPIAYDLGIAWEFGHRFTLQLPHQTNNVVMECIAQKLTYSTNAPHEILVEAVILNPVDFIDTVDWIETGNTGNQKIETASTGNEYMEV
jgi:hypothetical protein